MNLLTDEWIPVREGGSFRKMGLGELLCTDGGARLRLPRDDMEMAALQMLVCLTQVIFTPADAAELKARASAPMRGDEYEAAIKPFADWFDLDHAEHPFMQTRGVKAKEVTPLQKIFTGLPGGNSHTFFNEATELVGACPSCTSIAFFNQASNSPSLGGGFKGALRGSAPVTTLVLGDSMRETVWLNVLHRDAVMSLLPWYGKTEERPVWVEPISKDSDIHIHQIGLLRGLFWQPIHVELLPPTHTDKPCGLCGMEGGPLYSGFRKEKFNYHLIGVWPHPHSPRQWKISKGERQVRFLSFTTTAPTWTRLTECLVKKEDEKEGHVPAPVISSYRDLFKRQRPLHLAVGGYRNKQASILQRRHEVFTIAKEWNEDLARLDGFIEKGLSVRSALHKKLFRCGKAVESDTLAKGLSQEGSNAFYQRSEPLVHRALREMNWREARDARASFTKDLRKMALEIFGGVTMPYTHDPRMLAEAVVCRRSLMAELGKID